MQRRYRRRGVRSSSIALSCMDRGSGRLAAPPRRARDHTEGDWDDGEQDEKCSKLSPPSPPRLDSFGWLTVAAAAGRVDYLRGYARSRSSSTGGLGYAPCALDGVAIDGLGMAG